MLYVWILDQSHLTFCDSVTVACQTLCPWDSLGKNIGVGCYFLPQLCYIPKTNTMLHNNYISVSKNISHLAHQMYNINTRC